MRLRFRRPDEGYVASVRLNAEESCVLTDAARFHGAKLSTYIKQMALERAAEPQVRWSTIGSGGTSEYSGPPIVGTF